MLMMLTSRDALPVADLILTATKVSTKSARIFRLTWVDIRWRVVVMSHSIVDMRLLALCRGNLGD